MTGAFIGKVLCCACCVSVLCTPLRAVARERWAVIVLVPGEAALSDSLTEVAIAKLAESGGRELVGLHELQTSLAGDSTVVHGGFVACIEDTSCVRRIGAVADVELLVFGLVERNEEVSLLELRLINARTARVVRGNAQSKVRDVQQLIVALQRGVTELLESRPTAPNQAIIQAPGADEPRPTTANQATIQGQRAEADTSKPRMAAIVRTSIGSAQTAQASPSHAPILAYGTGALSVIAWSSALVTGIVAFGEPEGATRRDAQADLERRRDFARATNGLMVAGGVLLAVSTAAFIWHW